SGPVRQLAARLVVFDRAEPIAEARAVEIEVLAADTHLADATLAELRALLALLLGLGHTTPRAVVAHDAGVAVANLGAVVAKLLEALVTVDDLAAHARVLGAGLVGIEAPHLIVRRHALPTTLGTVGACGHVAEAAHHHIALTIAVSRAAPRRTE